MDNVNNLCVFDVCGTLFDTDTTRSFVKFARRELGLSSATAIVTDLLYATKANAIMYRLVGIDVARSLLIKSLAGIRMEELDRIADRFLAQFLPAYRIHKTFLLFDLIRQTHRVEFCSATVNPVAGALSRAFGVRVISSELGVEGGVCDGRLRVDLLGKKHEIYEGRKVKLVVTDNTSDIDLVRQSESSLVISAKPSATKFWKSCGAENVVIF
jgi:phosphoserine phosphatase